MNESKMNESKMNESKMNESKMIHKYKESLSTIERKTMEIAKSHLGSSFSIVASVGYIEYLSTVK